MSGSEADIVSPPGSTFPRSSVDPAVFFWAEETGTASPYVLNQSKNYPPKSETGIPLTFFSPSRLKQPNETCSRFGSSICNGTNAYYASIFNQREGSWQDSQQQFVCATTVPRLCDTLKSVESQTTPHCKNNAARLDSRGSPKPQKKGSKKLNFINVDRLRNPCKVFLGGVGQGTVESTIRAHFSQYGKIVDCTIVTHRKSRKSRGFGFITYDCEEAAQRAVGARHKIDDILVECRQALPKDEARVIAPHDSLYMPTKIFVGGIPNTVEEDDFKSFFSQFGEVIDVSLAYDKNSHRPRGFGFVVFSTLDAAYAAVGKHSFFGKLVEAKHAVPRKLIPRRKRERRHSSLQLHQIASEMCPTARVGFWGQNTASSTTTTTATGSGGIHDVCNTSTAFESVESQSLIPPSATSPESPVAMHHGPYSYSLLLDIQNSGSSHAQNLRFVAPQSSMYNHDPLSRMRLISDTSAFTQCRPLWKPTFSEVEGSPEIVEDRGHNTERYSKQNDSFCNAEPPSSVYARNPCSTLSNSQDESQCHSDSAYFKPLPLGLLTSLHRPTLPKHADRQNESNNAIVKLFPGGGGQSPASSLLDWNTTISPTPCPSYPDQASDRRFSQQQGFAYSHPNSPLVFGQSVPLLPIPRNISGCSPSLRAIISKLLSPPHPAQSSPTSSFSKTTPEPLLPPSILGKNIQLGAENNFSQQNKENQSREKLTSSVRPHTACVSLWSPDIAAAATLLQQAGNNNGTNSTPQVAAFDHPAIIDGSPVVTVLRPSHLQQSQLGFGSSSPPKPLQHQPSLTKNGATSITTGNTTGLPMRYPFDVDNGSAIIGCAASTSLAFPKHTQQAKDTSLKYASSVAQQIQGRYIATALSTANLPHYQLAAVDTTDNSSVAQWSHVRNPNDPINSFALAPAAPFQALPSAADTTQPNPIAMAMALSWGSPGNSPQPVGVTVGSSVSGTVFLQRSLGHLNIQQTPDQGGGIFLSPRVTCSSTSPQIEFLSDSTKIPSAKNNSRAISAPVSPRAWNTTATVEPHEITSKK